MPANSREYQRAYRAARKTLGRCVPSGKSGKTYSLFEAGEYVAYDGEGVTTERNANGEPERHLYWLLANSKGDYIEDRAGLSSEACFAFLLDSAQKYPKSIHTCYGASYDTNMMLGDVAKPFLFDLWKAEDRPARIWHGTSQYNMQYRKRKSFYIAKFNEDAPFKESKAGKLQANFDGKLTLWDVIGFFQSSFVKALESYFPEAAGSDLDEIHLIKEMKKRRSFFTLDDTADVLRYCQLELKWTVALMNRLREYLLEAGLTISRHDGAGAVASALLKRENVKAHKQPTPEDMQIPVRTAYAGGRIEICKLGRYKGDVFHYDINSAYPSAMVGLPSLVRGQWVRTCGNANTVHPFSLHRVRYVFPEALPFYPLFYRTVSHAILFPTHGEGWYWKPEVDAAIEFAEQFGGSVDVLETWELHENTVAQFQHDTTLEDEMRTNAANAAPFDFVPKLYELRREWKRAGRGAQVVLKLGLNSLYGKLAQQLGGSAEKAPPFWQMEWAGYITSSTRAKLLRAALQKPHDIIFFATDGIFSTSPLDLPTGSALGEWDEPAETIHEIIVGQAGVYWIDATDHKTGKREWTVRCRGFNLESIEDPDIPLNTWRTTPETDATVAIPTTRFITLGSALASDDMFRYWRTWRNFDRNLDLTGVSRKRTRSNPAEPWAPHRRLVALDVSPNRDYEMLGEISQPYPLLWETPEGNEQVDGVAARIVDYEVSDSLL